LIPRVKKMIIIIIIIIIRDWAHSMGP